MSAAYVAHRADFAGDPRELQVGIAPALALARMAVTQVPAKVGELLKSIGEDVKTIAISELELAGRSSETTSSKP